MAKTMTDVLISVVWVIILIFVAFEDLRNFQIRNEAVVALVVLFLLRAAIGGRYWEAFSHSAFAAVMFGVLLFMYSRGLLGGGDVKLLGAAFLWLGISQSFLFSLFFLAFTITYGLFAKLGLVPKRAVAAGTKIPLGPCIAAAWFAAHILG
jgi:prepilin peptidase CpaA